MQSMERVKEASFEERHKLEKAYKERLKVMDAKLREVNYFRIPCIQAQLLCLA